MSDQEPHVFGGRYELHRRLARGGMADVFLARDLLLDRPVALKVLFPEFATDRAFVERFRREAQAAANLSHPHIVSVFDWGEENGTYFIVMEYVEGRSLAQILKDEGALLPDRAADVVTDVAAALGFAHRNGVIHRDVKPGNVLISPLGQVKVTDFGIARAVTTEGDLTRTGTVMGTATYFSPEQARGESVDPRSDVYSLGVVLYELLVGEPPFKGDSPVSVAYKHVSEQAELPTARNPRIPTALEAVTMKALAKNPANRYASAEELAADLRRYREGRPVAAEAIMPADAAAGAETVAVAAGAATTVTPAAQGTQVVQQVRTSRWEDEPPRRSPAFVITIIVLLLALLAGLILLARNLSEDTEGGNTVEVPSVVDLPQEEAVARLTVAGLKAAIETREVEGRPQDVVVEQRPAAGQSSDEGGTVTIVVNTGKPPVEVPDVIGLNEQEADRILRQAGFVASVVREEAEEPRGEVIDQNPGPGQEIPARSTVTITVSEGPGEVVVPRVIGLREGEARARLEAEGFTVQVERRHSDDEDEPAGTVIDTDPEPGTDHPTDEPVTIVVSLGPEPTTTSSTPITLDSSTTTSSTTTSTTSTTTTTEAPPEN